MMALSGSPWPSPSLSQLRFELPAGDFSVPLSLLLEPPVLIDGHALVLPRIQDSSSSGERLGTTVQPALKVSSITSPG